MRKLLMLVAGFVLLCGQLYAQSRKVSGKVTDEKGNPVANVSVLVLGGTGTTTNDEGSFTINVPANAKTIVFSSINFVSQSVSVLNKSEVNVSLVASDKSLAEVVVVGYGTQKRKDLTGNLSTVKGNEISQMPVQSFEQALAGKATGVQITVPNGVLNAPPVFRIRGVNSLSLSSYPLIVIDGIPTYTGDQGATNAPANALASINPNDIESIDIAKDAAAAAIYGSRAANGVVFITTKKGKSGKARVSYDGWVGLTDARRLPEVLNATQYVAYKNAALANLKAIVPATTGSFIIPNDANGQPINTNWEDEVYHQGVSQNHSISISGGNDATTYFFSTGFTDQEGILRKNKFQRKNILFSIDNKVSKMISLGGKVSYSNEKNIIGGTSGSLPGEGFSSAGAGRLAVALPPNVAPYNNDGTYNIASGTAIGSMGSLVNGSNPFTFNNITMLLNLNRSNNEIQHLQSNVYFQLKPLNWVTLRTVYGIDNLIIDNDIFYNPYHGDGAGTSLGPGGGGSGIFSKDKSWVWTSTAQFDYTFALKHNVSALIGNEQQRRTFTGFGINRRTLSDSAYDNVQAGFSINNATNMGLGENYLLSNFGRLNYNYLNKYYLSGNIRQDEYSALGIKKGTFWGVSAGWEIAKERFWETLHMGNVFSSLKFRGSYGKVGNIGGFGNYPTYSTYSSGLYGGVATLGFNSVGNNVITWETSEKTDVGFSFGFFKNRLTGDIAYYKNNINGLVLQVPQSPSTGLPSTNGSTAPTLLQNAGAMYNKGIEIMLSGTPVAAKNFTWNSTLNFSYNKNEVTALANGLTEILTQTSSLETVSKTLPGYSAGYLWLIRTGGVDPASGRRIYYNGAGQQVLYQNQVPTGQFQWSNPDGTRYMVNGQPGAINSAADAVLVGNTIPKYIAGFDNTVKFKDFDLNVLLTYQGGFNVYYGTNAGLHDNRFWNNSVDILDYWQKPGDVAKWPKPIYGDNTSNGSALPSDVNMFKGDFVKVKNVSLGYTLPKSLTSKISISSARVYVSGQNLAIITDYPGPDPEVSSNGNSNTSSGIDRNTIANGRTITIGVNIGF